jgi:hypothetical protein
MSDSQIELWKAMERGDRAIVDAILDNDAYSGRTPDIQQRQKGATGVDSPKAGV